MMIILMNQTMGLIDMKNSKMTIIFLLFEDHDYSRPWRILHTSSRIIFCHSSPLLIERKSVIARSPIIVYYLGKIVNAYCTLQQSETSGMVTTFKFFPTLFNTIVSFLSSSTPLTQKRSCRQKNNKYSYCVYLFPW